VSHWIGVASRDHVLRAVEGGFLGGAFLAENASLRFSARLARSDVHETLLRAKFAAPLEAGGGSLSFLSDARGWGLVFRRGLFRVPTI
jgi:hypothetical protein